MEEVKQGRKNVIIDRMTTAIALEAGMADKTFFYDLKEALEKEFGEKYVFLLFNQNAGYFFQVKDPIQSNLTIEMSAKRFFIGCNLDEEDDMQNIKELFIKYVDTYLSIMEKMRTNSYSLSIDIVNNEKEKTGNFFKKGNFVKPIENHPQKFMELTVVVEREKIYDIVKRYKWDGKNENNNGFATIYNLQKFIGREKLQYDKRLEITYNQFLGEYKEM